MRSIHDKYPGNEAFDLSLFPNAWPSFPVLTLYQSKAVSIVFRSMRSWESEPGRTFSSGLADSQDRMDQQKA